MTPNTPDDVTNVVNEGVSLRKNIVTFTGPPDSGKSNLVKYLLTLPHYQRHMVYDPLFGFDPETHNVVRPPNKETKWRRYEHGNKALNEAVDRYVLTKKSELKPKYFIVDEAGRLLPNGKFEGSAMGELNDFNAHHDISVWLVGQRLAQLNSDFENKATHHFVMGYKGKNDREALRELHADLPDALDRVKEWDPFGFAYAGPNNELRVYRSVPEVGDKSML